MITKEQVPTRHDAVSSSVNRPADASVLLPSEPVRPQSQPASIRKSSLYCWFANLTIAQKHLLALLICQLVPLLGVGTGMLWLTRSALLSQLQAQARSEVAVTQENYNVKVNQMGFGFRGQSDNPAIIQAAKGAAQGESLPLDLREQVKTILKNEVKTRQIEYATLVGKDLKIIANANANRQGETFNPNGLVSELFKNPRQIKANEIVSSAELAKEAPSVLPEITTQDALIRYTVTPVRDPDTDTVIGALVSGDVVNGKRPIIEQTLQALGSGYSAVYFRRPSGEWVLATSLQQGNSQGAAAVRANVPLPNPDLLNAAAVGTIVTDRLTVDQQAYTVAVKALPNKVVETEAGATSLQTNQPTAILVRGTPETGINTLLWQILWHNSAWIGVGGLLIAGWLAVFRRAVAEPLKAVETAADRFAQGDRQARAKVDSSDEVGQVAHAFNTMAEHLVGQEMQLSQRVELQQATSRVIANIRRSLDSDTILQTAVTEIQALLQVDRLVIYRFHASYLSGEIVAEAIAPGWLSALGQTIEDPLESGAIERFLSGQVTTRDHVRPDTLSHCHCALLQKLQVQANMVAPIISEGKLIALLCAHQCAGPRHWQAPEVDALRQLAAQVGFALEQATLLQQTTESADWVKRLNELILHLWSSLDTDQILKATAYGVQEFLKADRAIVYQFDEQWQGTIVSESVVGEYPRALGAQIADPCFIQQYVEKYRQGRVHATPNIYEAGLTACHLRQLEPFAVKANLVAPILVNSKLYGLLIVHQCSGPRNWQDTEISFFRQVAIQVGFALEQAALLAERELDRQTAQEREQAQRWQREELQRQLIALLNHIEGMSQGDLTVRAEVTVGEIGTVADFFNALVESLRQIVIQVKTSALQVSASVDENDHAIQQLAQDALQQMEETTRAIDAVKQMTQSIQSVSESAQQAAIVAQAASSTAQNGAEAMDLTVHSILNLRETIGEMTQKVKQLGESSQQISKAVNLIRQIAVQTKLLAINAGIEAARAGEQGQGFAIVAEEVGELAARSAAATQEIEQIVDAIQQETTEVVEAMDLSTTQVVEGTQLVSDAKQSLTQILTVSHQIDQLVQSISVATVSQVETSQVISHLMQEVAEVSKQTSGSSLQVSTALRQTVEVARELQASVETFKVN